MKRVHFVLRHSSQETGTVYRHKGKLSARAIRSSYTKKGGKLKNWHVLIYINGILYHYEELDDINWDMIDPVTVKELERCEYE